jgi:imidazolonepropionase-like amidohydrolase
MKTFTKPLLAIVVLLTLSVTVSVQRTLVRAGKVLEVKTGKIATDQVIVIEGDKIVSAGPASSVKLGMSPLQAIQTATINDADLLGWSDKVGTIEPGKWADIIAADGDPLQDVTTLQHVKFVMKGGAVVKNDYSK